MARSQPTRKYDVALSFAGEDRQYVDAVALSLRKKGLRVFYDMFEEADLAGRNLVDHLSQIYQKTAHLCVVFVSAAYARKPFPRLERQAAQARALESDEPYIIPVRLDETEVPGLLATVAFVSGKTPEGLSELIASKLLLSEPPGFRLPETSPTGGALLVRFRSLIEPDMEAFRRTIQQFEHWAEGKIGSVPVELRIPQPLQEQVGDAKAFRLTESWTSAEIGEDARQQFSKIYDERVPAFLVDTVRGIQTLVRHYWFARESRLEKVVRRFLMTRMTTLCRLLLDYRLIGMPSLDSEPIFGHFGYVWSEWVMYGLPYACFLDGDERFLWVDADGRDTSTTIIWPQDRFRLYAPSELLLSMEQSEILTEDQFDRFFATQFLYFELEKTLGQPLRYFAQYPDRLQLTVRGEWAIETQHFEQHGTSNFDGKPLFETVRKLREHVLSDADQRGLTDIRRHFAVDRIRFLFSDRNQFDAILFPENA